MRELEAKTGCYFISDAFLVENERAVDYAIGWIETFQSLRKPCAGLNRARRGKSKEREYAHSQPSRAFGSRDAPLDV